MTYYCGRAQLHRAWKVGLGTVMLVAFIIGILGGAVFAKPRVTPAPPASAWAECGILPPPPISCPHCIPVCLCDAKGNCSWHWMSR